MVGNTAMVKGKLLTGNNQGALIYNHIWFKSMCHNTHGHMWLPPEPGSDKHAYPQRTLV